MLKRWEHEKDKLREKDVKKRSGQETEMETEINTGIWKYIMTGWDPKTKKK